jgi:predicted 3-demethylubiquinone-9 3-methyltransferase (glyoxalase superfamily)
MRPITPHLWFDKEAKEAAEFYASLIPGSSIDHVKVLKGTPSGDCDVVEFHLAGHPFMAISAGPLFKFNPSISFFLNFDPSQDPQAREHLDATWDKLIQGGQALMKLDKYDYSERYGWVQDRYGLSWQLILSRPEGEPRPFLMPSLMFSRGMAGKADEAIRYYTSIFKGSKRGAAHHYSAGMEPDTPGSLAYGDFNLAGGWFAAMDSARVPFAFNEAVSLVIPCESQAEIDKYWKALAVDPNGGQCGWTPDKYGVQWQITPVALGEMLRSPDAVKVQAVTEAFLAMKKFDLAALQKAFDGA